MGAGLLQERPTYARPTSNMIREKAKSCGNLKQKEGEGSKAGKVNASKGWSDHFRKTFGLKKKKVKVTGEAASTDPKAADSSQEPVRESLGRNGIGLKRFLMQMKVPCSGGEMSQRTFCSKKEKGVPGFRRKGQTNSSVLCKCSRVYGQDRPDLEAAQPPSLQEKITPPSSLLVV